MVYLTYAIAGPVGIVCGNGFNCPNWGNVNRFVSGQEIRSSTRMAARQPWRAPCSAWSQCGYLRAKRYRLVPRGPGPSWL